MNIKVTVGIVLASLLFIGASYFLITTTDKTSQISSATSAKAVVTETQYNWGTIAINDGNVEKTFTIQNGGTDTLKLFNIKTSCMCTIAKIKVNGQTSPPFGMHEKSNYVAEVPSGKKAELTVIFDPAFHGPSGVGPITRLVQVETNDKENPQLAFNLEAEVVSQITN